MRHRLAGALAAVAVGFCPASEAQSAAPKVVGVVAPARSIVPKDGAYLLVVMQPYSQRDKEVCQHFVKRYGAAQAYAAGSGAFGLYWIVGAPRPLTTKDCMLPPQDGLADGLYDYQQAPQLIRELYLPRRGGPFLVVVKCDPGPDGRRVNAGYIDLGRVPPDALQRKFAAFEEYLAHPANWGKKRVIDRNPFHAMTDFVQTPIRLAGRNVGAIKRMAACKA